MERHAVFTTSARYKCLEDLQRDSSDLYLGYCGAEKCMPGHSFGPTERTLYVIHFVRGGKGRFCIGGREYEITEGEAFLIPPGETTYYEADAEQPWEYWWIGFHGIKAYEYILNTGFDQHTPVMRVEGMDQIIQCINNMLEAHQLTIANDLRRKSELMKALALLIEENGRRQKETAGYDYPGAVYVKQAVDYLTYHYHERVKINELADYIGINRCYLTNSFKKQLGMSPQEYLVRLRMDKAASLIRNTGLPVSEIAARVGYEDPLAFSKIFRQKYGVSPRKWREMEETLVECHEKGFVFRELL
ncbi:MAG: AraC family transcriptional regulator [Lachnospiraceae bacterium]|nr:AraC family transcriptional regulator [Lachnospiraceae bacterium]